MSLRAGFLFTGVSCACVMCFIGSAGLGLFYWSPEKRLRGLLAGREIGYEMEKRVCGSVSHMCASICICDCVHPCGRSCASVLSVPRFKERWPGAASPFLMLAKVSPWQLTPTPLTHTCTHTHFSVPPPPPPAVLMEGALSCNRGNLSTSLVQSCLLWSTL